MTNIPPPPTPRDRGAPTVSEIIPFQSTKINILKSGLLLPFGATAAACLLLFFLPDATPEQKLTKLTVLAAYMLFCIFFAAYTYSGLKKNPLIYLIPVAIVYYQLTTNAILMSYFYVFRFVLPGDTEGATGWLATFISMFFGAGLMEELLKAVPALFGLAIARNQAKSGAPLRGFENWLKVSTPLEGVVMGVAAGAAFIFAETMFEYMPNQVISEIKATGNVDAGFFAGIMLMIPRILNGIIGHMAWAGISGYFIGMAARYPSSMAKLLAVGWLLPATLHALWNASTALGVVAFWISAGLSLFIFLAAFLKAKQIEATLSGGASTDSIVVGPDAGRSQAAAPPLAGVSDIFARFGAPKAAPASEAAAAAVARPAASAKSGFALSNGGVSFSLVPGQTLDLAAIFPAAGVPAGSMGEVSLHPQTGATGLKNRSSSDWLLKLSDGQTVPVPAGRHVKLAAGAKIVIGAASLDIQSI